MKHQIICTKTEKDFYTGEKGMGVLCADRGFPAELVPKILEKSEYTPVQIPSDIELTRDLCEMMPKSFMYTVLNGEHIFMQNTFVGRDNDGDIGLAHWIIPDKEKLALPIEYYLSPSFTSDAQQLADGYCGVREFAVGSSVNVNKVMKFISAGREKTFAQLVKRVLVCRRNKQRIIIADSPDNIPLWIGAVCYALPSRLAKSITFTTYAFDPMTVQTDICGAMPDGTVYSVDSADDGHVVFDAYAQMYPNDELCEAYFEFLINGMTHDYSEIENFNKFIDDSFDFSEPCYDICIAYTAYTVLKKGVLAVGFEDYEACASLLSRCCQSLAVALSEKLCSQCSEVGTLPLNYLLRVLATVCSPYRCVSSVHRENIRASVAQCVLMALIRKNGDREAFNRFYNDLRNITGKVGFSLSGELMNEVNRKKLTAILGYDPCEWKAEIALTQMLEYLGESKKEYEPLSADSPFGRFICDIVSAGKKNGTSLSLALCAIKRLGVNNVLLSSAYSRCVSSLEDGENDEENVKELRRCFAEICANTCFDCRREVYDYFVRLEDYATLYAVFDRIMRTADVEICLKLFGEMCDNYFSIIEDYSDEYFISATELFYGIAKNNGRVYTAQAVDEIFSAVSEKGVITPSCDEYITNISLRIPLACPENGDRTVLNELVRYVTQVKEEKVSGRLLALVFGIECEKIDNIEEYYKVKETLKTLTESEKVVLLGCDEYEWRDYFNWILPIFTELMLDSREISFVRSCLITTPEQKAEFCRTFAKECIRQGRDGDYTCMCKFLTFLFEEGEDCEREAVAAMLKKLNSKRLDALCASAEECFGSEPIMLDSFNALLSMPVKKSGLFGSLFKKK